MGLDYHLGFKKTIFSISQFFRSLGDILAKKTVISRNTKLAGISDGKKTFFQKPTSWREKNHFFTEIFFSSVFFRKFANFSWKIVFTIRSLFLIEKLSGKMIFPKNLKESCKHFWIFCPKNCFSKEIVNFCKFS